MPQVAEVFADLKFRVQGTGDVTASTRSVQRAMQEVQQAATSASAEVRVAGRDLAAAVDQVEASSRKAEAARAKITAAGDTMESLGQKAQQAGAQIEQARADLANLQAESAGVAAAIAELDGGTQALIETWLEQGTVTNTVINNLARFTGLSKEAVRAFLEQGNAAEELQAKIKDLTQDQKDYNELLEEAQGLKVDDALAAMEKQRRALGNTARRAGDVAEGFEEVQGASRSMNGSLALNRTTMRGLVTTLRSGRVSSSLFAGGLRGVAGALSSVSIGAIAAAAAMAALVAIPIFVLGKLAKDINSIGKEAALVPPQINAISDSIGNLAGVTQSQLNRALDDSITKFKSLGAAMPDRAAATTAQLGSQLQFLSPGAFDAEESIAAVNQAVQQLDASPLARFGVDVGELNEELRRLADDGVSAADRAAVIAAASMDHLVDNMAAVEAQAERERNSLQGVAMDFRAMLDAAANSEQVREVVTRLGEAFRNLLPTIIPVIKAAVDTFVAFGNILAAIIEIVSAVIDAFKELGITIESVAKQALRAVPLIGFPLEKLLGMMGDTTEQGNDLEAQLNEIGKGLDLDELLRGLGDADIAFEGIEDNADRAKTAVEQFSETTSAMRGLESQLRSVGQAFANMNDVLDPAEVTDFVGNLAGMLDFISQRGAANVRASLEAEAELLRDFLDMGLLTVEQYKRGLEELEAKQAFADPLIRKVEEMEAGFEDGRSAADRASGAIEGTGVAASGATSFVDGLISSLNSIPSQVGTSIHVGVTGPGAAFLGGGGGFGGGFGGPQPRVPGGSGVSGVTTAAPGTPGGPPIIRSDSSASVGADRGLINRATEIEAKNTRKALEESNRLRGIEAPSRGGGGGGGGSMGASIEEIREFFRQVNAVIMSGIRGGTIFSTAGNAIPVGAPGEFLNTKGGALIQTVNIRGVWDFADPAAKRQIIKELEESLAGLKREVA